MEIAEYILRLDSDSASEVDRRARALTDFVREIKGVQKVKRLKDDETTMDLGTIVSVVVASGAATALGRGLADWLRGRRGTKLTVERRLPSGTLKTIVEGIDPESASTIIEALIRS